MAAHDIEDRAFQIYKKLQREKCLVSVYRIGGAFRTTKTDGKLSAARQGSLVGVYDHRAELMWIEDDLMEMAL